MTSVVLEVFENSVDDVTSHSDRSIRGACPSRCLRVGSFLQLHAATPADSTLAVYAVGCVPCSSVGSVYGTSSTRTWYLYSKVGNWTPILFASLQLGRVSEAGSNLGSFTSIQLHRLGKRSRSNISLLGSLVIRLRLWHTIHQSNCRPSFHWLTFCLFDRIAHRRHFC